MRRFEMHDCVFTDCRDGIKIESSEGATFEDLHFRDIKMQGVNRPLYITATRFSFSAHARRWRPPVGRIRGLRLSDIQAESRLGDPANPFDRTCAAVVSLPGNAIEDVVLNNVKFTFPGAGTAEQASRFDVAELLHCGDYMEWAKPFDDELPASVLYLRHLRDVRLQDVRLTVERPDARPFIAADDIDGFTLQHVVGSTPGLTPGLVKLADSQDVTAKDCRLEGNLSAPLLVAVSDAEQSRLADLRERARVLDEEIQRLADAADDAKKTEQLAVLPIVWDFRADPGDEGEAARWFAAEADNNWTKLRVDQPWTVQGFADYCEIGWYAIQFDAPPRAPGDRILLRFGAIHGTCRAWLDGQLVGERTVDPAYANMCPWVLDVTKVLRPDASHRLVVRVLGNDSRAGMTRPVELLR
jgi:hypothetical protein